MQGCNRKRRIVSIILAAGKGTRMQVPYLHKVCFPLDGKPVIARSIEGYERCGIHSHFLVVGPMTEQVMQAASLIPTNLYYCHQLEQRGTGNAAKTAAKLLQNIGYEDDILVVAGDKVLEDSILTRLIDTFYENDSDLAFVVGGTKDFSSSGRIIRDEDSRILGNVEVFDIARMQLLIALRKIAGERTVPAREVENLAIEYFKREKKAALALGSLWDTIKSGEPLTSELLDRNFSEADYCLQVDGKSLSPSLLHNAREANLSVYLYKAPALYASLEDLSTSNAQQEEYLTDTIGNLSSKGCKLNTVPLSYTQEAMAFNTHEELKEIEEYISGKEHFVVSESPRPMMRVSEWLKGFENAGPGFTSRLSQVYGEGHPNVETKRRQLVLMLRAYLSRYGNETVLIARSPGRVNIMGRHIDHQGGHCNMIGIDKDFYMIIGARDDRDVFLSNLEPHQFAERRLNIDNLMEGYNGGDWLDFVNSQPIRDRVASAHGDWSQYVIAPIVRFQAKFSDIKLKGMNILAAGDVPIAAGLSSSSSIVVATTEGITHLNNIDISEEQFVELCGEGEWYVGTRGGAGDHAAMKLARRGQVVQVGFFPFRVTDTISFPTDYMFLVCNSREKARKTTGAKDTFNHRVACYHIGREIFKQEFPWFAPSIEHLRDINAGNLGVEYTELLGMLKRVPATMRRDEVRDRLTSEQAGRYLGSHSEALDSYPIRSVLMFGMAEYERCRTCGDLFREGKIDEFGRWMNISHNGDRVAIWGRDGDSRPFEADYSYAAIDDLISNAQSGIEKANLVLQPGGYGCSIPQIDRMVDIALSVDGVVGAQLSGAGLGGCIMALVHCEAREDLERAMTRRYYEPAGHEPDMFACYPVAGSGII